MIPLVIGDVEVLGIFPEEKVFKLIVHMKAAPIQLHTTQLQRQMGMKVAKAVDYMTHEGFLPTPLDGDWKCVVTGICDLR